MHTLNVIKNLEMMRRCWNDLSKKTTDWAEIRTTIEDQLTVQQSWNLHPRNPNQVHTGPVGKNKGHIKIKVTQLLPQAQALQSTISKPRQLWSSRIVRTQSRQWAIFMSVTSPFM